MRLLLALVPIAMLAGCGGDGGAQVARPARAAPAPAIPVPTPGRAPPPGPPVHSGPISGQRAEALVAMFGTPAIDIREGPARKLQFANPGCVLDVYLYPQGRGEPVATYVETRLRDGRPADINACVASLRQR